ncbi:hypothetical protein [Lysobacter silvisoli]|uniref:Uncharacterized protein n=1 Tax=Lysobacter silvisoli TaxID=2293254 RepID=A0A371K3A5_9GAMM|nr:hypothetical protein [Lysobacter silvisoli]RDZ28327.1 hypothetical protein DX914_04085 [Lysobacter silvisoli]
MELGYNEIGADHNWRINVTHGTQDLGTIRKSADGARYEYYHGVRNDFCYSCDSNDLSALKRLLSLRMGRSAMPMPALIG